LGMYWNLPLNLFIEDMDFNKRQIKAKLYNSYF